MAEINHSSQNTQAAKKRFVPRIKKDKCKSCQLCIAVCPGKHLEFSKDLNKKGVVFVRVKEGACCSGCKACVLICPDNCIEITEEKI